MQVHLYSMHGKKLPRQFSLGAEAAGEGITQCLVYGGGLVALTASYRLWAIQGWEDVRPQKLAPFGLGGNAPPPHCLAVIQPTHTLSGCVEVSHRLVMSQH